MEYITSGKPFNWWYILFDYAKELCDNFEEAASYRKSEGKLGKRMEYNEIYAYPVWNDSDSMYLIECILS